MTKTISKAPFILFNCSRVKSLSACRDSTYISQKHTVIKIATECQNAYANKILQSYVYISKLCWNQQSMEVVYTRASRLSFSFRSCSHSSVKCFSESFSTDEHSFTLKVQMTIFYMQKYSQLNNSKHFHLLFSKALRTCSLIQQAYSV